MTNPCPFQKPFERVPHQPGSTSRVLADDSHVVPLNISGDFSETGNETDLSASTEFLDHSLRTHARWNKQDERALFLRLALCRERVRVDRELQTGAWIQI